MRKRKPSAVTRGKASDDANFSCWFQVLPSTSNEASSRQKTRFLQLPSHRKCRISNSSAQSMRIYAKCEPN